MKYLKKSFLLISCYIFIALVFYSCSDPNAIKEEEFDRKAWKTDRNGCESVRIGMIDDLDKIKARLEGLDEIELRKILGKPDFAELYSRKQKFYTYYVDAAEKCNSSTSNQLQNGDRRVLQIRFDAIDAVNEVVIVREERNKK